MARPLKVLTTSLALIAVALLTGACGTEKISVPRSNKIAYAGAVLFAQRCAGCHTLSYAGTHGSAQNIRDREPINGPNFNVRCERPITRVLYAIENGGFSAAFMPQNIVVGQQAREVAQFVSEYAGHQAVAQPGNIPCTEQKVESLPPSGATALASIQNASTAPTSTTSTSTATTGNSAGTPKPGAQPTSTISGSQSGGGGVPTGSGN